MEYRMILLGAGLIVFGVWLILSSNRRKKRCTSITVGRITGIHECEGTDSEGSKEYSYEADYEYEVNGQIYRGNGGPSYSNPDRVKVGGDINIYYNPEKPSDHYTKGGWKILPLIGIGMVFFGVIAVLCGF